MSEERKTCQNPIQNAIEAGAKIYCFFEGNSFLDDKALVGTLYKGEESTRSLSFKKKPGERSEMETLANIFGCVGNPAFESGYKQVTGGNGQEGRRILTLHSSALLAFLCFHQVSEQKPFKLEIDEERGTVTVTFTQVYFEWKNRAIDPRHPSCVDVVLVGENSKGEKVILFLESKFTEYLEVGESVIRYEYVEPLLNKKQKDMLLFGQGNKALIHSVKLIRKQEGKGKSKVYLGGIKQMLAHAYALSQEIKECNTSKFLSKNDENLKENMRTALRTAKHIYLGEIGFDFGNLEGCDSELWLGNFKSAYRGLSSVYNDSIWNREIEDGYGEKRHIEMLPEILTYQEVFKKFGNRRLLNEQVAKFYGFGETKEQK